MPMPRSSSESTVDRLVINTGPLIALAKAEALDVVGRLPYKFLCPDEVREELDSGAQGGYPRISPPWLDFRSLKRPIDLVARSTLDLGEAAVIQLALEQGVRWVCIDEKRGRRAASAVGLNVVGALGLLIRAKKLKLVPALGPLLERLQHAGEWYDQALLDRVLKATGELS